MEEIDWDQDIWDVINSYFVSTENYLSKHQIESYDTFLDTNISKEHLFIIIIVIKNIVIK